MTVKDIKYKAKKKFKRIKLRDDVYGFRYNPIPSSQKVLAEKKLTNWKFFLDLIFLGNTEICF